MWTMAKIPALKTSIALFEFDFSIPFNQNAEKALTRDILLSIQANRKLLEQESQRH